MILSVIRLLAVIVAIPFAVTGFFALLTWYERAAEAGSRGERLPLTRESLARGLGGWARESGAVIASCAIWFLGVLPRARLRAGGWLQAPGEVRHGRPVLLVPGWGLNRAAMLLLARRLEVAHRPALAIDLPWNLDVEKAAAVIDAAAGELARATQSEKIDVVAHSRAGVIARWWIQKKGGDRLVERLVTLGSSHRGTKVAAFLPHALALEYFPGARVIRELAATPLPEGVRFNAINAEAEYLILPPGGDELPAPGVNVRVEGTGHTGLLFSMPVFSAVKAALRRPADVEAGEEDHGFEDESADEAAARVVARMQGGS